MKLIYTFIIFLLYSYNATSQVVINELDTDTPGQDFEEFIELKSDIPHFPLDGYVLVLFNGSENGNDSSYFALDLDGAVTDANGILLIGSTTVSPAPEVLISPAIIQNGADAVALYAGDAEDFPEFTPATRVGLIDALVYDTNDADDVALMNLLGVTVQINEDENNTAVTQSIQRMGDSYTVDTPTPGALNDGTGIDFNGISFTTNAAEYSEGDLAIITFTTQWEVPETTTIQFSLSHGSFTSEDFTGNLFFTIPQGASEARVEIQLLEDGVNDGDEFFEINIGEIPEGFNRLIDNVRYLIIDVDHTMAPWGTPIMPTYGVVASTAPAGYYNSLTSLAGEALRQEVQNIISDPAVVKTQTYADAIAILKEADQNPAHSNEVWLLYTEQGRPKVDFQELGGSNVGFWNREHTYPRSRGGFYTIEADEMADGPDIFIPTHADSLRHAVSDAHGLRAVDGPENSSRGNKDYGEYSGPAGNAGSWKGDAARAVMFLAVRYNGLNLVEGDPANSTVGELGDLTTLLEWHRNDPPDDFEMNRNNVVYSWQSNRNPFIDRPELVEYIFGDLKGETYDPPLETNNFIITGIKAFPNPSAGKFFVCGITQPTQLTVFSLSGAELKSATLTNDRLIDLSNLPSGVYIIVFTTEKTSVVKRVILQ